VRDEHRLAAREVDAQRGTENRRLDVVRGERVAREERDEGAL